MKLNVNCPACGEPVECEIALTVGGGGDHKASHGGLYIDVNAEVVSGPDEHIKDRHAA